MPDDTAPPDIPPDGPPDGPPDLATFVARLIEVLRGMGVGGNIANDPVAGRLLNEAWSEPLYVEEPFASWLRLPAEEQAVWLERYATAFLAGRQVPDTWEDAEQGILPTIRPRVVHVCWPLQATLEGLDVPPLPSARLTEHLVVELGWPRKDAVSPIRMADLDAWGVLPAQALETAAANLRAMTPPGTAWLGSQELPGVWRSPWQDGFDAARVVFAGGFIPNLEGPPVLLAPDASCLLAADGNDEEALFNLARAGRREIEARGRFLWLRPLRFEDGRWAHWLPPPDHGAHGALKLLYAVNEKTDYDRHGALMQRLFEREGNPVRVAAFQTMQDPLGNTFTAAVWEAGAPAALPVADGVILEKDGDPIAMAPLAHVREVLGDLLEERPGYPPRLLARSFPEDWQIAALRPPE